MKFKHFHKAYVLRTIGRTLLAQFIGRFEGDLNARNLPPPGPDLPEAEYFEALAALLMSPRGLPEELAEALFAIDEMANAHAQERLERAAAQAGLELALTQESSHAEVALRVWLAAPALLARKHNEQRLLRLTAFEYFGVGEGKAAPALARPDPAELASLAMSLDGWFVRHHRGQETTRIEVYPMGGEFWFLVRHGDTFTRAPKVERQRTEILHFRPERDDVVVYSPEHDEIRINARTRSERELYRSEFGRVLRGDDNYFSERKTYTLEPLRTDGPGALDPEGLEGIGRITLLEVEVARDNCFNETTVKGADDLFECAAAGGGESLIPTEGRLTRAAFALHFIGCPRPRPVQILPPNTLRLGRHCDARLVDRWLSRRGFRIKAAAAANLVQEEAGP